ncbi:response regulator transcription factor [Ketobacter sp. MCCC 1A13808]|uniref:response regulator transcription factor n=1 Tax=Ketobacter sp. MCCC 1A13808 TaxID=2602738 RepID=UPI000F196582|nr:response regulator transcription factor [Ketobacter sp. MCCC 1A13808]MVF10849.1 response regulator transcription factor [Ketobacter sp. MCCC 1A13808]RLP56248.1 MAG: DNA-binding response regulator [Ketobacter sp.]
MRVLVVEDEQNLRQQLKSALQQKNYSVDCGEDGEEGRYLATEYQYDVAIVDIGLPKLNGIELVRGIREQGIRFPILILTARGHWQDKVNGLEAGADDYVVKPFEIEEVLARLNALIRRSAGHASPVISVGPIALDTSSQQVRLNNQPVELTSFEYKVLEYLMLHPGDVVSKTVLTEHIYAQDFDRDSNTIEVFVGRLRKKLDPDNLIKPIETLRGRGYRFALER